MKKLIASLSKKEKSVSANGYLVVFDYSKNTVRLTIPSDCRRSIYDTPKLIFASESIDPTCLQLGGKNVSSLEIEVSFTTTDYVANLDIGRLKASLSALG